MIALLETLKISMLMPCVGQLIVHEIFYNVTNALGQFLSFDCTMAIIITGISFLTISSNH